MLNRINMDKYTDSFGKTIKFSPNGRNLLLQNTNEQVENCDKDAETKSLMKMTVHVIHLSIFDLKHVKSINFWARIQSKIPRRREKYWIH